MRNADFAIWIALAGFVGPGCREVCSTEELRHGDKCVPRPDASSKESDGSSTTEEDEGGALSDAGAENGSDAQSERDDAATDEQIDACTEPACDAGCVGAGCEADLCDPDPCANGGTCSPTGKLCTCPAGFSGPTCEVDACEPNPCQHDGVCSRLPQGTTCDCTDTGFGGTSCEADINECASINVCSGRTNGIDFEYACRNEQPFYSCSGQFPDWPLSDPDSRYSAYSGLVEDAKTGLVWQQEGQYDRTWSEANSYCSQLVLGGFADWRLPTRAELESIVDFGTPGHVLNPVFTLGGEYWSSSPFVGASGSRWVVEFLFGDSHTYGPITDAATNDRVRCVRRKG